MSESFERRQPAPLTPEQKRKLIEQTFYLGESKGVERVIKGVNLIPMMESFRGDPRLN